jgi:hypothetical protein
MSRQVIDGGDALSAETQEPGNFYKSGPDVKKVAERS